MPKAKKIEKKIKSRYSFIDKNKRERLYNPDTGHFVLYNSSTRKRVLNKHYGVSDRSKQWILLTGATYRKQEKEKVKAKVRENRRVTRGIEKLIKKMGKTLKTMNKDTKKVKKEYNATVKKFDKLIKAAPKKLIKAAPKKLWIVQINNTYVHSTGLGLTDEENLKRIIKQQRSVHGVTPDITDKTAQNALKERLSDYSKKYNDVVSSSGVDTRNVNIKMYQHKRPTREEMIAANAKYWDNRHYAVLMHVNTPGCILNKTDVNMMKQKGKGKKYMHNINTINSIKNGKYTLNGSLQHYNFSKDYDMITGDDGKCVLNYLMYELKDEKLKYIRKSLLTKKAMMEYFGMVNATDGVEYKSLCLYIKYLQIVTMYVYMPDGSLFETIRGNKAMKSRKSLVFILNNNHVYPVISDNLKISIIKKKRFDLMEYDFDINYDNHVYFDDVDNMFKSDEKVKLISSLYNLNDINTKVQEKTKIITTNQKYNGGTLSAFENDGIVYVKTMDYTNRKELLETIHKKTNSDLFKFSNQSYARIGTHLYNHYIGNTDDMLSDLSQEQYDIFNEYGIGPYLTTVSDKIKEGKRSCTIDYNKSYFDVILNNKYDYNVFTSFDMVQKYDDRDITIGEYYINRRFEVVNGSKINMPNGFYPHNFINYCLKNRSISKFDIKYMMLPSYKVSHEKLRDYAKHCMNNYDEVSTKSLVNHFIGSIGINKYSSDIGINTKSSDIAIYLLNKYEIDDHEASISWNNDKTSYTVRCKKTTPKLNTSLPVHRSIIAGGVINLCELFKKVYIPKCQVVSYNVDSVSMHYGRADIEKFYKIKHNAFKKEVDARGKITNGYDWKEAIGGYKFEAKYKVRGLDYVYVPNKKFVYKEREPIKLLKRKNLKKLNDDNEAYCVIGPPGVGKSYELCKYITKDDIVISFTNKAISNIRGSVTHCKTIDSLFHECKIDNATQLYDRVKKYNKIYVDEYSMVNPRHMSILYRLYEEGKKILFFGDSDQCLSISDKQYIYTEHPLFLKMINNNIKLTSCTSIS